MRPGMLIRVIIVFSIVANCYCAFLGKAQKKETNLKKEFIVGVTSEKMVLSSLGLPNSVATNNIGDEVWNYKNLVYSTNKSNDKKRLVLWELTTGDSTEFSRPFNLYITFDQNDILKNFEIVPTSFQKF